MALTPSNNFKKGISAPKFTLIDTISEKEVSLEELKGKKGTVIFFICNHCPFVIHINKALVQIANAYSSKGFSFIAISSNDSEKYPMDGPANMKIHAKKENYPFPYLYDETQEVAKAYDAACTPDLYVFDSNLISVYHGQLDDSRPGNDLPVTGIDIRKVLDLLRSEKPYTGTPKPSIGCNINWK